MNVFLGVYEPRMHTEPLWEMETDLYIHNAKVITMMNKMIVVIMMMMMMVLSIDG